MADKYYVAIEGKTIGWVLAASNGEAMRNAIIKYSISIEYGLVSVEKKSNKRKKRAAK